VLIIVTRKSHGQALITKEHIATYININFNFIPTLYSSNARNRGSTDESLDEDEESLLEVEDVTAYLRFNKEVCIYIVLNLLVP